MDETLAMALAQPATAMPTQSLIILLLIFALIFWRMYETIKNADEEEQ